MLHAFSRTEMLLGEEGIATLAASHVVIVGIGGVGSYATEGLARCAIGRFTLIDDDDVCLTNLNRQLQALRSTVGKSKVETMKERILAINPKAEVTAIQSLYNSETAESILPEKPSYVVDAIDMVSAKLDLIVRCKRAQIPIISAMGTGNKLDPSRLVVTNLRKTKMCPLARVIRKELRKRGIWSLKVVYSPEPPLETLSSHGGCELACICPRKDRTCVGRHSVPGSVSFVPSVAGLLMAGEVVRQLTGKTARK